MTFSEGMLAYKNGPCANCKEKRTGKDTECLVCAPCRKAYVKPRARKKSVEILEEVGE
mgnify:CR=1 FL=1